jgi:cytochrome c biogenesis protein
MFRSETELKSSADRAVETIYSNWKSQGFKPRVTRDHETITLFAQRNAWNRLGAYVVHIALLTIFLGGFLTSRYAVGGTMEIIPGKSSDVFTIFESGINGDKISKAQIPFSVECTDLQQQLVRPEGGLEVMNTIDWLSYIKIKEGGNEIPALVHLNFPFDHRGYRFFQSSFQPQGNARTITIETEQNGSKKQTTIPRDGFADIEGVGRVEFAAFYPDFSDEHGHAATISDDYNNPVAELHIAEPNGKIRQVFTQGSAFVPHKSATTSDGTNDIILKNFEKVATSHTLTIQYDPGRMPVYLGFALLTVSLCSVFLFSHQRVWAVIEENGKRSRVYFGGNTSRNRSAFEDRFNSLVKTTFGGKADDE